MGTPIAATRRLYWEITTVCQLACRYCFYETGLTERRRLRTLPGDVRTLLDAGLADSFRSVTFTGGEPLLEPTLWESIALLVGAGVDVSVITDGIRLDACNRAKVRDSGISRLAVSLDSLSARSQDAVRVPLAGRGHGTADIIENLSRLLADRPPGLAVSVLQTVHRANIDAISPMATWCREVGADLLVHLAGLPDGAGCGDLRLETCTTADLAGLRAEMLAWAGGHTGRVSYTLAAMEFVGGRNPVGLKCPMGSSEYFLDTSGGLYPCFHRKDLCYGNVRTDPFDTIVGRLLDHDLSAAPCATLACACLLDCGTAGSGRADSTGEGGN
ncbi:MAG: radical SAM protein [bacterium]